MLGRAIGHQRHQAVQCGYRRLATSTEVVVKSLLAVGELGLAYFFSKYWSCTYRGKMVSRTGLPATLRPITERSNALRMYEYDTVIGRVFVSYDHVHQADRRHEVVLHGSLRDYVCPLEDTTSAKNEDSCRAAKVLSYDGAFYGPVTADHWSMTYVWPVVTGIGGVIDGIIAISMASQT